jgi:hypothetical protein
LLSQGRADELYDPQILTDALRDIAGPQTRVRLQYFYGPQVAIPFLPFVRLSFLHQAELWVAFSLLTYFGCVYLVWRKCAALRPYAGIVALCALAYPPLFHFFVRGQISSVMLVCFAAAYLALQNHHDWFAGLVLGFLFVKPQFLVAIPLVLVVGKAWRALTGVIISAIAQLAFTYFYFGRAVMRSYVMMLLHSASQPSSTELTLSPIQMHSLRSFWALLIPSTVIVWGLYLVSSLAVIGIAGLIWKSASPLAIRFSSLVLASVLVNPHLYIYDLLALAPVFLLLADWILSNSHHDAAPAISASLYLSFTLPIVGPVSRWTHLQLSVFSFAALLCFLWSIAHRLPVSGAQKFATSGTAVV